MKSVENMIAQNVFALELCASKMAFNLLTGILFKKTIGILLIKSMPITLS